MRVGLLIKGIRLGGVLFLQKLHPLLVEKPTPYLMGVRGWKAQKTSVSLTIAFFPFADNFRVEVNLGDVEANCFNLSR